MKTTKKKLKQIIKEELKSVTESDRFMGGQIDVEPLSDADHEAGHDAYYELYDFLMTSDLPGDRPSEQLRFALSWIAKFEQVGQEEREYQADYKAYKQKLDDEPMFRFSQGVKEAKTEVSKSQLKRVVKQELAKALKESQWQDNLDSHNKERDTYRYVLNALRAKHERGGVHPSQRRGMPFSMGVNSVLDALWIDDVWEEDVAALRQAIKTAQPQSIEEMAQVVAGWLTVFRQGGHSTKAGRDAEMAKWR